MFAPSNTMGSIKFVINAIPHVEPVQMQGLLIVLHVIFLITIIITLVVQIVQMVFFPRIPLETVLHAAYPVRLVQTMELYFVHLATLPPYFLITPASLNVPMVYGLIPQA